MWKQNKQIVKLSDRKLKLCQRSKESLHILWLEQKPSHLFHIILRQACTVERVLGNGNHDSRSSRARPLRVRHQLHHCADSLACSCGRGDEDDDEDDFTKFVICFNCMSLLQSVVKLKRPNIYWPEDKKSVSQLYAKIDSDVWSDGQLIENLRRAWRSSSQLGYRPSRRCSRPHVSGWSPSLGKSWSIKTSSPQIWSIK